ncbi:hypothetical protein [Methanohalophilus halophilus]|uniref:DUF2383 domain-containing protein n=1 Tax=Methanohalophilus halophilus TaxID=2177 RepID=A0A1L3Q2U1_9EURY|nr:hypothetical protein [Methanohalophilus halophilus]APH39179.1 hypothetical protein BHR79_06565 [Methanohalophilus halophilus]RNI09762.1 hypothetical protein EFE40_03685 [Methanohalophilus halophilus]SDW56117.1 hypothetical protein SAMN04515625_1197 [Methanohalophilus halophilus]
MGIRKEETLISMLEKIYWIETEMVQLSIWEARIEIDDNSDEELEKMALDAERHVNLLIRWFDEIGKGAPDEIPPGLPEENIDFKGLDTPEIFEEILKYVILARKVYSSIKEAKVESLGEVIADKNVNTFFSDIDKIMADKEKHIEICEEKIGSYKSISSSHSFQ